MRDRARLVIFTALVCVGVVPALASAQASGAPTAEERRQAADAYDRGTSAMLSRDYAAAAHWFEQANRLAPAPVALMQAMRANERIGNSLRVANLALRLRDLFPNDAQGQQMSQAAIATASPRYVEVRVQCSEACTLDADGRIQDHTAFFIEPERNTAIHATFPGGTLTETVTGSAGSVRTLAFEAPPPPPEPPASELRSGAAAEAHGRSGLPRAVFWSGLGVTAALGGVALWSGLDTRSGVDAYEAAANAGDPNAQAMYDRGHKKEIRTDILIGATAGAAAITGVIAIFTKWRSDRPAATTSSQRIEPSVGLSPSGGFLTLRGRF